jgi:glutamine synthetase
MTETVEHLRDFNYYKLNQGITQVLAEYIWIDGTGERMRSKTKVLYENILIGIWYTYHLTI